MDIAELFARDPLQLTQEDIESICHHYREARQKNLLGDKKAGKTPEAKVKKAPVNLDLNDLEIDL